MVGSCVGTLSIGGVERHVLFDTGATHSFVSPDMVEKGMFWYGTWNSFDIVIAAGGQMMNQLGLVKNIPVMILDRPMPVDLIVVPLKNHEVILGMDWLGKYRPTLDCHWGRVQFENEFGPLIKFKGLSRPLVVWWFQQSRWKGSLEMVVRTF